MYVVGVEMKILIGSLLIICANISAWYGTNLQFVNDYWKDRPLTTIAIFAFPTAYFAYYGTKFCYAGLDSSLWGVRLLAYGLSYLVFPILTMYYLNESLFTPKTLTCIALSFIILLIQVLWR